MYYETFGKRFRNIAHAEMKGNCNMWLNLCLCILTKILDVHYKLNFEKKKRVTAPSISPVSRCPCQVRTRHINGKETYDTRTSRRKKKSKRISHSES